MESKVKHQYDASLALKAIGSAAATADETTSLVDIYRIVNGRGDVAGRHGIGSFDVVVHVTALDHTTGDETYVLNFSTYDAAGANGVVQESVTLTAADIGKTLQFTFNPATLTVNDADCAKFGIALDVSGTTPILQYWAFAAPHSHA